MKGVIVKGVGGLYYVKTESGVYPCRARGRFRKDEIIPMIGDRVEIDVVNERGEGFIKEILPRDNFMIRPPVANIDQVIAVFSVTNPDPNLLYVDKLLLMCHTSGICPVICINKIDLDEKDVASYYGNIYIKAGYKVVFTSTVNKTGIGELIGTMKGKVSAMAGPSGVGKSSLLNAIQPDLNLKTGDVSYKANRGKHTTKHVELLELKVGGYILDTPGFGAIDLSFLTRAEVAASYPEFKAYQGQCRFVDCLHIFEPGCKVKEALQAGEISYERYQNYTRIQEEVKAAEERRYD
ncbi:ribosome small subunit-dependent GTPase A [Caldanaerobius polysaccharolyticus]|uniref:ribosome small subunit-dependent GTPase A n=1 Tax=Caldanaerobius polysaccharolyticus TaxID=44256 RepID=UPI00047ED2DA|nr:ribosome small subunit-dependent GTPase A [Caldanaerobius polysaccharolyticus]